MNFCTNRPQYIVLFKGDDSDFIGNQEIIVELKTQIPLAGCKAYFKFLNYIQVFSEIPEDGKLTLVFPRSETEKFPLCVADGKLWLEDGNGKERTIDNRIHICVTNSVPEAYCSCDPQAITVVVSGGEYVKTVNGERPDENGNVNVSVSGILADVDVFDMYSNDWEFREAFAKLWKAVGGSVINE